MCTFAYVCLRVCLLFFLSCARMNVTCAICYKLFFLFRNISRGMPRAIIIRSQRNYTKKQCAVVPAALSPPEVDILIRQLSKNDTNIRRLLIGQTPNITTERRQGGCRGESFECVFEILCGPLPRLRVPRCNTYIRTDKQTHLRVSDLSGTALEESEREGSDLRLISIARESIRTTDERKKDATINRSAAKGLRRTTRVLFFRFLFARILAVLSSTMNVRQRPRIILVRDDYADDNTVVSAGRDLSRASAMSVAEAAPVDANRLSVTQYQLQNNTIGWRSFNPGRVRRG